jgi:transcription elongation factor GreA
MITRFGKQKLEEQLKSLNDELRRTIEERAKAAAEGDLRENSAYIFLGERAEVLRSQIAEIMDDLKSSEIQEPPQQTNTVSFGHCVLVRFESDKRELALTLVGKNDARLKPGWISCDSPIGQNLLGCRKNDTVTVNDQTVTILDIQVGEI